MHHSGAALNEPVVLFGRVTGEVLALASLLGDESGRLRVAGKRLARLFE